MTTHKRKRDRSTGSFTVTKSVYGPFTSTQVFMRENLPTMILVGARLYIAEDEFLQIALGLPIVNGTSSGELGPIPERVPFAYFDHNKKDDHIYYDAEKGNFEVTLIKQTEHFTGAFHFTSKEFEFEGKFSVYYFDEL
jgi:hypothetical protein